MNDELRQAAERLRENVYHVAGEQRLDDLQAVAAFALPLLDGTPLDPDSLPISAMGIADTKRLGFIAERCELGDVVYCPECGDLPPCVCLNHQVVLVNPTTGKYAELLHLLGIEPTETRQ